MKNQEKVKWVLNMSMSCTVSVMLLTVCSQALPTVSCCRDDEQREFVYDNFLKSLEEDLWELLDMDSAPLFRTEYSQLGKLGMVEVIFYHSEIESEEFLRAVGWDFAWAGLSIFFVWVYMLIHLGSFFLSLVGIFEIFMSFPVALFFYRKIFSVSALIYFLP